MSIYKNVLSWNDVCSLTSQGLSALAKISRSARTWASWSFLCYEQVNTRFLAQSQEREYHGTHHFLFDERLERVDLAIVLPLDQPHFTKGTLADDFERVVVLRSLVGAKESQEVSLGTAHAVGLALFSGSR